MIPLKQDIENELIEFVHSSQFQNFKLIMNDFANSQLKEILKDGNVSEAVMRSQRQVLEFYMKTPTYLERKVASIEKRKEVEIRERINKAQENL